MVFSTMHYNVFLKRGRDHGIPPFNDFREVCGLQRAKDWNDMAKFMQPSVSQQ